jgi:hypothetical protein
MASQNINLFQTKTTVQPLLAFLDQYVKIAAVALLAIVFSGGILVGIAFAVFGNQRDTMEIEKQQLLALVKDNVTKESLVLMIRNRLVAVDKIMTTQVSYAPFIDTTIKIIQSFPLSSFSMGGKNSVSIAVNVTNLTEAVDVLKTLMEMEQKKEISNPMLQSFSLDEKKIQIGLSYTVVL